MDSSERNKLMESLQHSVGKKSEFRMNPPKLALPNDAGLCQYHSFCGCRVQLGKQANGTLWSTCCTACARSLGKLGDANHDATCRGPPSGDAGLCRYHCGCRVQLGTQADGTPYQICCAACTQSLGRLGDAGHDATCRGLPTARRSSNNDKDISNIQKKPSNPP